MLTTREYAVPYEWDEEDEWKRKQLEKQKKERKKQTTILSKLFNLNALCLCIILLSLIYFRLTPFPL